MKKEDTRTEREKQEDYIKQLESLMENYKVALERAKEKLKEYV